MKQKTVLGVVLTILLLCIGSGAWSVGAVSQAHTWSIVGLISSPEDIKASLYIGANNELYVSYREAISISGDLKYVYNIAITATGVSYIVDTVDSNCGWYPSLLIDSNGNPHLSYEKEGAIKYAYKSGDDWVIETVETGQFRLPVSMVLDTSGKPHIVYVFQYPSIINESGYVSPMEAVRYAMKTSDGWIIETVREQATSGRPSVSIALDSDGKPHIAYGDADPSDAYYAVKIGSEWVIERVGGIDPSLALDSNNNPHISYYVFAAEWVEELGYVKTDVSLIYSAKIERRWINETVDSGWALAHLKCSSLSLDRNNNPHVSYSNGTHLKYAAKIGDSWTIHTMDSMSGWFTCLALDSNNSPHILYYGGVGYDAYLKLAFLDTVPPTAKAGPDKTVKAGERVVFDAGQSSDNIGIVSYNWDFGDGTTGTGKTTTHTYTIPGTYTVTLTVMDFAGNSAEDTATLTVEEARFPRWIVGTVTAAGITAILVIVYLTKIRRGR